MHEINSPIAAGLMAEVYAWGDGTVLKLFKPEYDRGLVEYEARMTHIVHDTGLPVPAVGEIVEINERFGFVLEKIEGISMLAAMTKQPWKLVKYANQLAELHVQMHRQQVEGLPTLEERLRRKLTRAEILPESVRRAALNSLEDLPEDNKLCHGDFHPGNVLLTGHGPIIIDWIDASSGSPILDLARSSLLFGSSRLPKNFPNAWLINIAQRQFYQRYFKHYSLLTGVSQQQLERWVPVVAAARLSENVQFDQDRLLSIANKLVKSA